MTREISDLWRAYDGVCRRLEKLEQQIAAAGATRPMPDEGAGAANLSDDPYTGFKPTSQVIRELAELAGKPDSDAGLREALKKFGEHTQPFFKPELMGPLSRTILEAAYGGRLIPIPRFRPASEWPGDGKPRVCRTKDTYGNWRHYVAKNPAAASHQFLDMELPE